MQSAFVNVTRDSFRALEQMIYTSTACGWDTLNLLLVLTYGKVTCFGKFHDQCVNIW